MSEDTSIEARIRAYLEQQIPGASPAKLSSDANLLEFAEFDSLGVLESLVWLETTFGMTIPDEDLIVENFATISQMVDYVRLRQSR